MTALDRLWASLLDVPGISIAEGVWYFSLASLAWITLYVLLRRWVQRRKISPRQPTWRQMGWEVLYSVRSLLVFGIVGGFMAFAIRSGWARMY